MTNLKRLGTPAKELVVTIHGVNSNGQWQEDLANTLGVLFDFAPVKYNYYRLLGSELLFCPLVWIPAVFLGGAAYWFGWIRGLLHFVLFSLSVLVISFLATFPYRYLAVREVKKRLSQAVPSGRRPHLIAHSFGTYVSGDTFATLCSTKFARVILAGCVLDENFINEQYMSWGWPQTGSRTDRYVVLAVRNEMASRDWIVRLAAKLDRLVPGFGTAGSTGFSGPTNLVHTVNAPDAQCNSCWPSSNAGSAAQVSVSPAAVHNVYCKGLEHSDYFLGANHAILYWIPFFWGYDPALYRQFLFTCREIQQAHDAGDPGLMLRKYGEMRQSSWGQFSKQTVDQRITEWFKSDRNREPDDIELDAVAFDTLRLVFLGEEALNNEQLSDRETWVRCLNPPVAIQLAYEKAMHGE